MCKEQSGSSISGEVSDTRNNSIIGDPNVEGLNDDYLTENIFSFKLEKTVDRFDFYVIFFM